MKTFLVLAACMILTTCITKAETICKDMEDKSAAIQKKLNDCAASGGGIVNLPAGKYRLDNPIEIPSGVTLKGVWEAPHFPDTSKGTTLLAYAGKGDENGPPLIKLSKNTALEGVTIFYPEQRLPGVQPYPWTIRGEGTHCSIFDVTLVNPYKGIDFATHVCEMHYVRNVYGCPLKIGISIDQCYDIGRVENVHFNPNSWNRCGEPNAPDGAELIKYLFDNCTAFEIGRSDWEFFVNTFSFGCKVGYRFYESKYGQCNGNFLGIAADWARTAVLVEETQPPGLLITNGEFVGGEGAETMVEVKGTLRCIVQFNNCSFWGPSKGIAQIKGGFVSMNQCNFVDWDPGRKGAWAVDATGGYVTVTGCRFGDDKNQIRLGPDVKTAVITNNTMLVPISIENNSKGDVQIYGNVSGNLKP